MKRKNRKQRVSLKLKKKAKRFKEQNPNYLNSLELSEDYLKNDKLFIETVIDDLKTNPKKKLLLSKTSEYCHFPNHEFIPLHLQYPRQYYEVVPTLSKLTQNKTTIISSPVSIFYSEKLNLSCAENKFAIKPSAQIGKDYELNFEPDFLIQATNPLPTVAVWPLELKPYFNEIAKTYRLQINYSFPSISFSCFPPLNLKGKRVFTTLSMGKESLYSLYTTISNKSYKKIVVAFVNNTNYGSNYREKEMFNKFSVWFTSNKVDTRVSFHQLEYNFQLVGSQSKEENIHIQDAKLKEPLVKMQYIQLLAAPLFVNSIVALLSFRWILNRKTLINMNILEINRHPSENLIHFFASILAIR